MQHDGIRVNIHTTRTTRVRTRREPVISFSRPISDFSLFSEPFPRINFTSNEARRLERMGTDFFSTRNITYSGGSDPFHISTSSLFPTFEFTNSLASSDEEIRTLFRSFDNDQTLERDASRELDVKESDYIVGREPETCCICHDELQQGNKVIKLGCKHTFHSECLKEWGKHKPTCPNCRKNIPVKGARGRETNHRFGSREL